jgi:antitoxin component YwqK of YwqJK toxin-antitoxin module
MRNIFIIVIIFISHQIKAQCVTYRIGEYGDTLNCKDKNNQKQGKWVIHVNEVRGEPGYEEEGIFKDDKKEGKWRKFNLMGDLIAIENYRWGFKDGVQQYFYMNALEHEERWLAIDPKKKI